MRSGDSYRNEIMRYYERVATAGLAEEARPSFVISWPGPETSQNLFQSGSVISGERICAGSLFIFCSASLAKMYTVIVTANVEVCEEPISFGTIRPGLVKRSLSFPG
jgi:hypothetical protein